MPDHRRVPATARGDIFAGLVSSTVAIPLAMAFGVFAFVTHRGAPP